MLSRVMEKTGATERSREILYKVVVQTVLLYGRQILVIPEATIKVLEVFCHCIASSFTGKTAWRVGEEGW